MKLTAPKYLAAIGIVDKDDLAICKTPEFQHNESVRGERQGFDRLSILYSLTAETALRGCLCCG